MATEKPICAREGRCNNYNGVYGPGMTEHATCDAGVNYRELAGGVGPGWIAKLPCINASADCVACNKRTMPTPEQIAAWDAWVDDHFKVVSEAMKRCRDDAAGKRGLRGQVECPACKGRLHYSVAATNGHLWGNCETADCLSWMQ